MSSIDRGEAVGIEPANGQVRADSRLATAWLALRIGLGLGTFVAGLDKFLNLLTTWSMYLSPLVGHLLPVNDGTFMRCVGVVEMLMGLAILSRWTHLGGYLLLACGNRSESRPDWQLLGPGSSRRRNRARRLRPGRFSAWRSAAARAPGPRGRLGDVVQRGAPA